VDAYSAVRQLAGSAFEAIAQRLNSALDMAIQAHARAEITVEQVHVSPAIWQRLFNICPQIMATASGLTQD
jgi:hypothetical protein